MSLSSIEEKPTNVKFESQDSDEKLYFLLRRHPITNVPWIILVIFFLLVPPIFLTYFSSSIDKINVYFPEKYQMMAIIFWYLGTLLLAFESFLMWYFNVYIITNKRVIDVDFYGLWRKRISETFLDRVEDATYETTNFIHVLFDFGNIAIQTAAEEREFDFHNIPKPSLVHDKLTDLVEQYKHSKNGARK